MDNIQCLETFRGKIFFFFDYLNNNIGFGQCFLIVLLLTLFTEDQQSFPINAKIVLLQSKAKERSLTTFQETRYEINRYCNFVHNGEPP